jgi:hypothetical protein
MRAAISSQNFANRIKNGWRIAKKTGIFGFRQTAGI